MMVKEKVRRRLDRKEKEDRRKAGRGWQERNQRKEEGKKVAGSGMWPEVVEREMMVKEKARRRLYRKGKEKGNGRQEEGRVG
jgi:hypothetical protein